MIEEVSEITREGQTTLPDAVRRALGVDAGGTVVFRVSDDGITVHRAEEEQDDPALEGFLALLGDNIALEGASDIPQELATRILDLTNGIVVDLDENIEGPVAL